MNKIQIFTALIASGLLSVSCGDAYLDATSKRSIDEGNYYRTIDDAEMALIGCYDGYQRTVSDGYLAYYLISEVASDNCFGGTGNGDGRSYQVLDRFDISESQSDVNLFNGTWSSYYAGIFRCNTLLLKLDDIDFSEDPGARTRIEGETRFLRAIMYYELVQMFGNIPLLTEPTTDNIPQADPTDVYKLVVEDLLFAIDNIPATAYPKSKADENDGRVTPYAAKALLARVYLYYTGYYGKDDLGITKAQVLQGLEDIIASNEYSLVPEYKSLWPAASYIPVPADNALDRSQYAGEGNSEVVFAQKFNNTSNYSGMVDGNRFIVMLGFRNTTYSPYGRGWGACTVNPELVNAFDPFDKRLMASVIDIVGEGVDAVFDFSDQREYTGYAVKKYAPTAFPDGSDDLGGASDFQLAPAQDYFVIRYADVLLMAAEMGSSRAQDYYDMVRTRAGLSSRSATYENIMEERHFEFAFEGLRYWDLLRQGVDVAANAIATSQDVLSGGVTERVTISAENVKAKQGLMQIPSTQITLSGGVLVQNPGW